MPQQLTTPLLIVVMVAAFYFLMIRPQQKRARAQRETLSSLGPGTRVLLANGFYATVVDVADTAVQVELAPGVSSWVVKQAVVQVIAADVDPAAALGSGTVDDRPGDDIIADEPTAPTGESHPDEPALGDAQFDDAQLHERSAAERDDVPGGEAYDQPGPDFTEPGTSGRGSDPSATEPTTPLEDSGSDSGSDWRSRWPEGVRTSSDDPGTPPATGTPRTDA